jgi:hypothetical protein
MSEGSRRNGKSASALLNADGPCDDEVLFMFFCIIIVLLLLVLCTAIINDLN